MEQTHTRTHTHAIHVIGFVTAMRQINVVSLSCARVCGQRTSDGRTMLEIMLNRIGPAPTNQLPQPVHASKLCLALKQSTEENNNDGPIGQLSTPPLPTCESKMPIVTVACEIKRTLRHHSIPPKIRNIITCNYFHLIVRMHTTTQWNRSHSVRCRADDLMLGRQWCVRDVCYNWTRAQFSMECDIYFIWPMAMRRM